MRPPDSTIRVLQAACEAVAACTSLPVEVTATTGLPSRLPAVMVDVAAPVPVSNGPDSWAATLTLTVTVLHTSRASALEEAHALVDRLLAGPPRTPSGILTHTRLVSLPTLTTVQPTGARGVWAATGALTAIARH